MKYLLKEKVRKLFIKMGLLEPIRRLRTKMEYVLGKGYIVPAQISLPTSYIGSYHAGYSIYTKDLNPASVVYSFGLGDDISFDLELIDKFGLKVFGADPTPKTIDYLSSISLPSNFNYLSIAIADYDGDIELFFPKNESHVSLTSGDDGKRSGESKRFSCCTVQSFMKKFNHEQIDLLKMDIKGPEFKIIPQLLEANTKFSQLIVEFTPEIYKDGRSKVMATIALLNYYGYKVFYVSADGRNISLIHTKNYKTIE